MRGKTSALVWAAAAVLLTIALVLYPKAALEAARDGMNLFLNVVFPSRHTRGEGAFVLSMGLAAAIY